MNTLFQVTKKPIINIGRKRSTLSVFEDGTITLIEEKMCLFKPNEVKRRTENSMHCSEIRFITDMSKNFNKYVVRRHTLYFGHKDQMTVKYLSPYEVAKFKKIIIEQGADIASSGQRRLCWTLSSPSSWIFGSEYISIDEDSISYSNKKEATKVKFDEIEAYFIFGSWYSIGKNLYLFGEQNICPKYKIHIENVVDVLKRKIKVPLKHGIECKSNFFWRIFHPFTKNPSIFLMSDGLGQIKRDGIERLFYGDIESYDIKRPHFYSWCGDVIISGNVTNVRDDQSGLKVTITKTKVGRFTWRKIKKAIKTNGETVKNNNESYE